MTEDTEPMSTRTPTPAAGRWTWALARGAPLLILGLFYLYVWLRIDPGLLYQREMPAFITTVAFFRGFLDRPGGVAAYVSAFLMQSCWYPWLGAVLITVIAGLICLVTRGLIGAMTDRPVGPWVSFVPVVLLVMVHGQYKHLPMTSLALLAALGLANLYVRIGLRSFPVRLAIFAVLAAGLDWAAGGMVVLFGALCGVFELLKERRIALGALCILFAAALPFIVAACSYRVDTVRAFVPLVPYRGGMVLLLSRPLSVQVAIHVVLLLFFPAALVISSLRVDLWRKVRLLGRWAAPAEPTGSWTPVSLGGFLVVGALLALVSFNADANARLRIDYHADHGNWEAVLENARRLSPEWYDLVVVHEVNRALYHAGRLPREMFSYPQKDVRGALTSEQNNLLAYRKLAQLFLELGRVNMAQHWGHMAQETHGESPPLLKLLVKVSVLKRRIPLARTYLRALAKHLLWRGWAREQLRRLETDPLMTSDREIAYLRSVMVSEDYRYGGFGGVTWTQFLTQPLQTNPRNRMAFEYLMMYFMLAKRPDLVVSYIRRLDDFNDVGIPRHWEEAILVHARTHPDVKVDLGGRQVSPETVERFRGFLRDVLDYERSSGTEKEAASDTLARRWGDTYFFYFTVGYSEPRPGWRITRSLEPEGAGQ